MATSASLARLGTGIAGPAKPSRTLLRLGQFLTGASSTYTITKQLNDFVWLGSNQAGETVVIKSAPRFRIAHERDVMKKFQSLPSFRPLLDEIVEPADPAVIVMKHLDDDLLHASNAQKLTTRELKFVSKRILEALQALHEEGYVHTDVKIENVLVNYAAEGSEKRFTDVQLCDFEGTVRVDSPFCKDRHEIGTPISRSPEATMCLQWGPPTDIWSFGNMVISLIWGDDFSIFKPPPGTPHDSKEYILKILEKYHIFFGPYPQSFGELCRDEGDAAVLNSVMRGVPPEKLKPFALASKREISTEDKEFILKVMKIDPRDRPTAKELLKDDWFKEVSAESESAIELISHPRLL
ncbi:serine/threonine protein kinase [Emergomyces pasteurianus Ep9510]|uniref:Serine/threonine protein kinase n=1 Tax=Emergomyces pasteurianus Ep9510 TaxID=1447872 RepID=A0A1J9Q0K8_9EURO|nr:serine/threonine protein kinase [Emergomyces pasteurianus Ep9510]